MKISKQEIKETIISSNEELLEFIKKLDKSSSYLNDLKINENLYNQVKEFKDNHYHCVYCDNYFIINENKSKKSECCENQKCIEEHKEKYIKIKKQYKQTCLEKYGVDNPSKSQIVKKKIENSMIEKYGYKTNLINPEYKEKIKQINLEKYGYENPFYSKEMQEQFKQTKLKKFGYTSNLASPKLREQYKQTMLEKYGYENPFHSKEMQEQFKQTKIEEYGSPNNFEKIKQTNLEKYNTPYYFQTDDFKQKSKETNLKRYGVEHSLKSQEIQDKIKKTNLKKYGVEYPSKSQEIQDKIKKTNLERYGVEYSTQKHIQNYKDYNIEGFKEFIEDGYFKKDECKDYFKITNDAIYKKRKEFNIQEPVKLKYCKKQNEFLDKFEIFFNIKIERNIIIENKKPDGFFIAKNDILIKKNIDFTKVKTHIPFDFKDIFIPKNTKVILEFDGDYFHGFLNDKSKVFNITSNEAYLNTIKRALDLKSQGYKVIRIWEYYYDNFKDFYNYLEDYDNLY